jgi:hypothetical protein
MARRELDDRRVIGGTTDASRGWLFFDLILAHAGIEKSNGTTAALVDLHAYHTASNLWEYVPPDVVPALEALRGRGLRLVVVSNAFGVANTPSTNFTGRWPMFHQAGVSIDAVEPDVNKPSAVSMEYRPSSGNRKARLMSLALLVPRVRVRFAIDASEAV